MKDLKGIIFAFVAMAANSLMDAINFTHQHAQYDELWHWLKWPITFFCLIVYGYYSWPILHSFEDLWHKNWLQWWWLFGSLNILMLWYPMYHMWRLLLN